MGRLRRQIKSAERNANSSFKFNGDVISFKYELTDVARQTEKAVNDMLYKSGNYLKKTMQTVLSKVAPRYPKRYIKRKFRRDGTVSSHYQKFLKDKHKFDGKGRPRPPYKRTGKLQRLVRFKVDREENAVYVGPEVFPVQKYVKSRKPGPRLLDEGGSASIRVQTAIGRYKFVGTKFRDYPYVMKTYRKASRSGGLDKIIDEHFELR